MSNDSSRNDDASSAGWEAITASLERHYPGQKPVHWGTIISFALGGVDPLDGISAYRHEDANGESHWHYVSFGLSELYAKESEHKEISGWGFEFTFRLKRGDREEMPPQWPAGLMQNLARYVFKTGNTFSAGHSLPLNGPIALDSETELHAAMFIVDPELGEIDTPNGKVIFLQLVGTTMDELAAARRWDTKRLLTAMQETNPLLVTDLTRKSLLGDVQFAKKAFDGAAQDGSSTQSLAVRELNASEIRSLFGKRSLKITIGASGVDDFRSLLQGRIGFDRPFTIFGPKSTLSIYPADTLSWIVKEESTELHMPGKSGTSLANVMRAERGEYSVPELPNLIVRVVPTEIRDHTGKTVVKIIG